MSKKLQQCDVEQVLGSAQFQLLSGYTKSTDSIYVKCLRCNHERHTNAGKLMYEIRRGNSPCPHCSGVLSLNDDIIDNRLMGGTVKRVSSYVNDADPMTWKCSTCSHTWNTRATKVLNDHTTCPKCSYAVRSGKRRLSTEEITKRLVGRNITMLSQYISTTDHAAWKCDTCQHEWRTTPEKVLNAYTGCPHCAPDGKFGRKTKRGTICFDSGLEAYCYDVLTTFFDVGDITLQHQYPHNTRMKVDFYIPTQHLWIEVSNIKTRDYLAKIEGKREAVEQQGAVFIFASSPNHLQARLREVGITQVVE